MTNTTASQADADLRATLGTLIERWQQQIGEYVQRAETTRNDRYAQYARIRATRTRSCLRDMQIVLNTGHIPYDLMTNDELANLSMAREDAEIVEAAELTDGRSAAAKTGSAI